MSIVIILILVSLTVALLFLAGFVWAVRSGQYEDTLTPSLRVLAEDSAPPKQKSISVNKIKNP
jgi:cbb3-type cytochrome oxidase maturation protein